MLWSLWEKPGLPVKYTVNAYLLISLFLIFMNALNVAVLGPTISGISQLPFSQNRPHFIQPQICGTA
ncbi:hypothetical protein ACFTAO_05130 [Paenibacillus rhizoplanae]